MKMRRVLAVLSSFLAVQCVLAMGWESYTSMDNVKDIEYREGNIWGAAEGGIFRFDLNNQNFELFTRADGLLGDGFNCLAIDSTGKVWCGGYGAYVNIYDPSTKEIKVISALSSAATRVNDICLAGESVFVGADNGVHEIFYEPEYDDYFIKGSYVNLGGIQSETNVNAVFVHDGYLWAGSDSGAARIEMSIANKQPAANWESFTVSNGLAYNVITSLAAVNDTLYAASRFSGIARFEGSAFHAINIGQETQDIRSIQDTLYMATSAGIKKYYSGSWEILGENIGLCWAVLGTPDGAIWAGRKNKRDVKGGLSGYIESDWNNFWPNAPGGKYVSGLLIDSSGNLWCGGTGSEGKGVYIFDGLEWLNFTGQDSAYNLYFYTRPFGLGQGPVTFLEDNSGRVWTGSYGSGAAVFMPDGQQFYFNMADSLSKDDTARLDAVATSGSGVDFCVAGDMIMDDYGNIWMTNRESIENQPLVMIPSDFLVELNPNIAWIEYYNYNFGANDGYFDYLEIDDFNCLWLAGNSNASDGIRYFDFNGTVFDKSDDFNRVFTSSNNSLLSNPVTDIEIDQDNRIWAASASGVCFYQIDSVITASTPVYFDALYDLYSKHVNCITVDPMNNKWFGTEEEGVIVFANDNYTILEVYTAETHPLLDNRILDIVIDPVSGIAYMATPQGISALQTPYRTFDENLGDLKMGPVPFYPELGEPLTFASESLAIDATVKIFTNSGLLVRSLNFTEASLGWDGKDNDGRFVGSGVYIVMVAAGGNKSQVGKVPVFRR